MHIVKEPVYLIMRSRRAYILDFDRNAYSSFRFLRSRKDVRAALSMCVSGRNVGPNCGRNAAVSQWLQRPTAEPKDAGFSSAAYRRRRNARVPCTVRYVGEPNMV